MNEKTLVQTVNAVLLSNPENTQEDLDFILKLAAEELGISKWSIEQYMKASTKLLAQAGLEIYATNDDETGLKKYCTISTINEVGEKLMASKEEKVIMRGLIITGILRQNGKMSDVYFESSVCKLINSKTKATGVTEMGNMVKDGIIKMEKTQGKSLAYSLTTRAICETNAQLREIIRTLKMEPNCGLCSELVVHSDNCSFCKIRYHSYCAKRLQNCKSCKSFLSNNCIIQEVDEEMDDDY